MSDATSAAGARHDADDVVLRLEDLHVWYHTDGEPVRAVDGVSFTLRRGERFGLAGESGSGKSTVAAALIGLVRPPGRIEHGRIELDGVDVTGLSGDRLRRLRLAKIALVPQGAMNSLNPVRRIRDHFRDNFRAHERSLSTEEMRARMVQLLGLVGLREEVADRYPHELSGGMKQRVCIALSITQRPDVIAADEPTSALDVVVQRQVVQTLRDVQSELGAAVLLVGHDMGLLAQFVNRLGVMHAGKLVEVGPVESVFAEPAHPYTRMLISSLPSLDERRLTDNSGEAVRQWRTTEPDGAMEEVGPDHWVLPFETLQLEEVR